MLVTALGLESWGEGAVQNCCKAHPSLLPPAKMCTGLNCVPPHSYVAALTPQDFRMGLDLQMGL